MDEWLRVGIAEPAVGNDDWTQRRRGGIEIEIPTCRVEILPVAAVEMNHSIKSREILEGDSVQRFRGRGVWNERSGLKINVVRCPRENDGLHGIIGDGFS